MKFPKLLPYLFASALFVLGSCSEDDGGEVTPIVSDCKPTKITDSDGTSTFTYVNDKISTFSEEEMGTGTVTYGSNGRPNTLTFNGGSIEYLYANDNNTQLPDGMLVQSEEFEGETGMENIHLLINYEYNSAKRIKAVTRSIVIPSEEPGEEPITAPFGRATYEYDGNGNVILEKEFSSGSTVASTTTNYTYDNKKNPAASFQGLFAGMFITPPSTNNILTAVVKNGSMVDKEASYTNTYEYNSGGYPTKITRTPQQGTATISNVEYSCK